MFFHAAHRIARLYSIAVAPEARGTGIGEALLAAAERHARTRGAIAMRLEVRADNAAAQRLYERRGYRRFGIRRRYYEDGARRAALRKGASDGTRLIAARAARYATRQSFSSLSSRPVVASMAMSHSLPSWSVDFGLVDVAAVLVLDLAFLHVAAVMLVERGGLRAHRAEARGPT